MSNKVGVKFNMIEVLNFENVEINYVTIYDILNLKNVRIDTKIEFVLCLQPETRKVMQKGV